MWDIPINKDIVTSGSLMETMMDASHKNARILSNHNNYTWEIIRFYKNSTISYLETYNL